MKKNSILILVFVFALTIALTALGNPIALAAGPSDSIQVVLDEVELSFDAQPRIVNGRTLVPLRGVFEAMGATVLWNGDTKTVTALRLDSVVKLVIGSEEAIVNKKKTPLDVPAQLIEGRTFVPLRFISESMGADVGWDEAKRTVTVATDKAHWSDAGDNLSNNLLFTSTWIDTDTGEKMIFAPEMFIQINENWQDDPEGLYYSYSETNEAEENIIAMFMDGAHLKDHYYEFDADTRILSEYLFADVLSSWRILDEGESTGEVVAAAYEKIGFITQEYDGDNIVEIPYIEYDGEMNPEIDAINRFYNQGLQFRYEEFLEDKQEHEWIEIKSYPFTSDKYLQIVTSLIVYPNYGTDGDFSSVNYDREAKEWLSTADILVVMGLAEDDVIAGVKKEFVPDTQNEQIDAVKIAGFLIHDTPEGEKIELLLIISVENTAAQPWDGFFSYFPDDNPNTNDLTRLNNHLLFDPYNMDQMAPPLFYQNSDEL